ncbi:MAG: penicillin-binding protein 2 [candidate division WOR-3 bacterium]
MKKESIIKYFIITTIAIMFIRLFQFQVLQHDYLSKKSIFNYLKEYKIRAPRGKITDRNGIILADWRPSFRVLIIPKFLEEMDLQKLYTLFGTLDINIDTLRNKGSYIEIKRGLSFKDVISILEKGHEIRGLLIDADPVRIYSDNARFAAHLLGYVGEASKEELKKFKLDLGDYIGKNGIERVYDSLLRGKDGYKFIALDSRGNIVDENPTLPIDPVQGKDIKLTIDINLQVLADSLFGSFSRGAAFAFDIRNGEVYLLYSKPGYDPRDILQNWNLYTSNPERPLLNRCIQGLYPPGSTFKLITTLVGLYTGNLNKDTKINCSGGFNFGKRTWLCWRTEGHGTLDLEEAIAQSCNVYFNTVGARIGSGLFMEAIEKFNLPLKSSINLPGEYEVTIPLKRLLSKRVILPSSVVNWSIGQGEVQVTPIWLALITGLIATNGKCPLPRLCQCEQVQYAHLEIPQEYFDIVKEGMRKVVETPGGTASYLFDPKLKIAGKTGTAQNPHGKEHSWFTCFFPHDDPQFVVTVIVENAGHGSEVAAPIAFKIARRLLNEKH